jgi:osmotically-inducible protein OsmY
MRIKTEPSISAGERRAFEATRDAAVSIARAVDGVASVDSKIRVGAP